MKIMQNHDFDSKSILEKYYDFDLDLENRYSTSVNPGSLGK